MKIFTGSSNPKLAGELARVMGVKLGKVELSQFPNGEKRVIVREERIDREAIVIQSLVTPVDEMIVELALLTDALVRMGVHELTAVVPWLGYAKQDKVFQPGEPLSIKVVAKLLQVSKFARLVTFDLHNSSVVGFFEIPVVELSARPMFLEYFRAKIRRNETVVVAPDAGAVKASTKFAKELGVQVVYMDKERSLIDGKVKVKGISGEVEGKEVIIVDDNVVTGSTLIETARELVKRGAKGIRVGVTHHMYVPGVQIRLEKCKAIKEVVVTDTVMPKERGGKLKILSVAEILRDALVK